MKRLTVIFAALAAFAAGEAALAQSKVESLDQLLELAREGRAQEAQENKAREAEFRRDKAKQAELLKQAKQERIAEERRSEKMEEEFDVNEQEIAALQETLTERLGSLKELFGVLQQSAGDARGQFENSLVTIQYPERIKFLTELVEKMSSTSRLASMDDLERLWFELQREMTESGKVARFTTSVIRADGTEEQSEVTRVGVFNLVSDGKFYDYRWDSATNTARVVELGRQPKDRFVETAERITNTREGLVPFAIDPTRGQLLNLLIEEPTLAERFEQGGVIGKIIILGLGGLAVLLAAWRLVSLTITGLAVAAQKKNPDTPKKGNPLGRVLKVYHDNPTADVETLELKLGEAVLKETPKLTRANMLLKVIAVVAPLLGLLGTVTGMIITFQAITLFGTGDPKLMAGGISQALVTTVCGLVVAIPTVLLHTIVAGRSKGLVQVLEEQAAGLVARRAESGAG
mgnify:CR=1 FL=1